MQNNSTLSIVIRTPNWLGDLLISTAFIQAILEQFPESTVDLIVKKGWENLPLPHRGRILPFDKSTQSADSFGKALQKFSYDVFYVLPTSFSSAWMAYRSQAKKRIGYRGNGRNWFLSEPFYYQAKHRSRHLIEEYLDLCKDSLPSAKYQPTLWIDQTWVQGQLQSFQSTLPTDFVCIAPGAVYGPAKQWPWEYFQQVVIALEKRGIPSILLGTQDDSLTAEKIVSQKQTNNNLCGKTTVNQMIALLAKSKGLVSNDSGAMHVMAALNKPQISIFGSTSPVWTGPLNPQAFVQKTTLDCSPCFQRTCRFNHYQCLHKITPESVWKEVEKHFLRELPTNHSTRLE